MKKKIVADIASTFASAHQNLDFIQDISSSIIPTHPPTSGEFVSSDTSSQELLTCLNND